MRAKPDTRQKRRKAILLRIRDLALEATLALLFLAAVLYAAAHSLLNGEAVFRWIGLAACTAVAFGYPLRDFRSCWRRRRFWLAWTALLILHLAGYAVVLLHVEHFGTLWFAIITPAEWAVIYPVLEAAGGKNVWSIRKP